MLVGRRILLPAVLASVPAQIALVVAFGNRSVASLLDDPLSDWAITTAWLGSLIALGYVISVLPVARFLAARRAIRLTTILLLLAAVVVGGAIMVIAFLLPAAFLGGGLASALVLSLLGSMVGLVALVVCLPLNADLVNRASGASACRGM